jgi:hypothetical protein
MIGVAIEINRRRQCPYSPESREFFNRALVEDPLVRRRHDQIVRRLKTLGLWNELHLWYGADAGAMSSISPLTPVQDGQSVRRWINRKGDYSHAEQSTGSMQPVLDRDGGPNGVPALITDGADDYFEVTCARREYPYTCVFFGRNMGASGVINRNIFWTGTLPVAGNAAGAFASTNMSILWFDGVTVQRFDTMQGVTGNACNTHVFNGASSAAYRTGSADKTGSLNAGGGYGPDLYLFGQPTNHWCGGAFSHLMIFNKALTKSNHTALETLLFGS